MEQFNQHGALHPEPNSGNPKARPPLPPDRNSGDESERSWPARSGHTRDGEPVDEHDPDRSELWQRRTMAQGLQPRGHNADTPRRDPARGNSPHADARPPRPPPTPDIHKHTPAPAGRAAAADPGANRQPRPSPNKADPTPPVKHQRQHGATPKATCKSLCPH